MGVVKTSRKRVGQLSEFRRVGVVCRYRDNVCVNGGVLVERLEVGQLGEIWVVIVHVQYYQVKGFSGGRIDAICNGYLDGVLLLRLMIQGVFESYLARGCVNGEWEGIRGTKGVTEDGVLPDIVI